MSDFSASASPEPTHGDGEPAPPAPQDQDQDDQPHEVDSFFPAPPRYYKLYTPENVAAGLAPAPPNVEWVLERGSYSVFGETWPIQEAFPTLEEQGLKEMFIRGQDRATSLLTLLRAMLLSYQQLVSALLVPPPSIAVPQPEEATDPERLVEHIRLISINMHFLVNELRPVQARENLRAMMRAQIDARRAKTAAILAKCTEVTETLARLQLDLGSAVASEPSEGPSPKKSKPREEKSSSSAELRAIRAAVDALDDES